jgi:hypothetical protein
MKGVAIRDMHPRGYLSFDLKEVLACLHEHVRPRTWRIQDLECSGEASVTLHGLSDRGDTVTGPELIRLAERVNQVIDGTFAGSTPGGTSADLIIRAVDSSFWEVFGDAPCLCCIQAAFHDVKDASQGVWSPSTPSTPSNP